MSVASSPTTERPATRRAAAKALAIFFVLMAALTWANGALNAMTMAVVSEVSPQRGALERRIEATGQLSAANQLTLAAPTALRISKVYARPGMHVEAGAPLYAYDPEALAEALQNAQASLQEKLNTRHKSAGTPYGTEPDGTALALAQSEADLALARYEQAYAEAYATYVEGKDDALTSAQRQHAAAEQALAWAAADMSKTALEKYAYAQADVDKAWTAHEAALLALAEAQAASPSASALQQAQHKADSTLSAWEDAVRTRDRMGAVRTYFTKQEELADAQEALAQAQQDYDDAVLPTDAVTREIQRQTEGKQSTLESAQRALTEKQRAERDLVLEIANQDAAIRTQQAATQTLFTLAQAGGVVYAPVAAEVVSTDLQEGQVASANTAVYVLKRLDDAFELCVTVTEDEAGDLAVGDEADITVGTDTLRARIMAITGSQKEAGRYEVSLQFAAANGRVGMNATMRLRKRTEAYDMLVPLSALRQDNMGYFVYIVEQREGALGTETVARRVDVSVLERDSRRAAVQGGLTQWDRLIARSDRSLNDGDRVRVENT